MHHDRFKSTSVVEIYLKKLTTYKKTRDAFKTS